MQLLTNCKDMRWHCPKRFSLIRLYCFWRIYFRYVKVWVHCNQNVCNICLKRKNTNIKFSNYYFHLKLNKAHRRKKIQQKNTFDSSPNHSVISTGQYFSNNKYLHLSSNPIGIWNSKHTTGFSPDFLLPQRKHPPPTCSPRFMAHHKVRAGSSVSRPLSMSVSCLLPLNRFRLWNLFS